MPVQTSTVHEAIPWTLQFQGIVSGQRPTQIVISPSTYL